MSTYDKLVTQRYDWIGTPPPQRNPSLASEIHDQVIQVSMQLEQANPGPAEEDYLAKVGRLNALRKQAEEIVLADLLPPAPDSEDDLEEVDDQVNLSVRLLMGPTDPDHPLNAQEGEMNIEEWQQMYRQWAEQETATWKARHPES